MKKTRLIMAFILLITLVFSFSLTALAAYTEIPLGPVEGAVIGGRLNLRASPSKSATILEYLPDRTKVQVYGYDKINGVKWYKVKNNSTGWVVADFILLDSEAMRKR